MAQKTPQKTPQKSARKKVEKPPKKDGGLTPEITKRLRSAIREVWQWTSHARRLCLARAIGADGFPRCEACREKVPKVFADHIEPAGKLDFGFIDRMFCSSRDLQALCKRCHDRKTRQERKLEAAIADIDSYLE